MPQIVADSWQRYRQEALARANSERQAGAVVNGTAPGVSADSKQEHSITALSAMSGWPRKRVRKYLRDHGVIGKGRKKNRVPVSLLQARAPEFWAQIQANLLYGGPPPPFTPGFAGWTDAQLCRELRTPRETYLIAVSRW